MKIDDKLLSKLEKLSALNIEDSKREEVIEELSKILEFVEILNELDLDSQEATFTTVEGGTPFREDSPTVDKKVIETILENAPKSEEGFFIVPKIIE